MIAPDGDRREESQVSTTTISDDSYNAMLLANDRFRAALRDFDAAAATAEHYASVVQSGAAALQSAVQLFERVIAMRSQSQPADAPRPSLRDTLLTQVIPSLIDGQDPASIARSVIASFGR